MGNQGRLKEALAYFEQAAQLGDLTGAQYAAQARQQLGQAADPPMDPAQQAFRAFAAAGSLAALRQTVQQHPLLLQLAFIAAIERAIAQQVAPAEQPAFAQRLVWLRQLADEQAQ